jgi:hypothetical protein
MPKRRQGTREARKPKGAARNRSYQCLLAGGAL